MSRIDTLEDAVEEFLRLRRSGSHVAAHSFAAEHPQFGAELLDALESLEVLEFAGSADDAADALPERMGEFEVLERIASGGMGVVYRARQPSLGRDVALKLIRPELMSSPSAKARFRREATAAARLQHPGVAPIHAIGEADGVPYFAMELFDGATLGDMLRELLGREPRSLRAQDLAEALSRAAPAGAKWDADVAAAAFTGGYVECVVQLVLQVAEALDHAHSRGVLHRDVKPSNIAVTSQARAMLFDFGLAHLADGDERLTLEQSELGSLAYMPPEQLRPVKPAADARSDVYSLGVTLFELLTLRLPFRGPDTLAVRNAVLAGAPPSLRSLNPAASRDLEIVCAKAMEQDLARRYGDAAAFARDLRNVLERRPIEARPPSAWVVARRWTQRHPVAATAAAVLVLAPSVLLWRERAHADELGAALGEAQREREAARIEAHDAREVSGFLAGLFRSVDPSEAAGQEVAVREVLAKAAAQLEAGHLSDQPAVRARLLASIGESYASLGDWENGERLLQRSTALAEQLAQSDRLTLAKSLSALASLEQQLGRAEALSHAQRAVELHRERASEPSFDFADALTVFGIALGNAGRLDEAEANLREALAVAERLPGSWESTRAGVLTNLASLRMSQREYADAIELSRRALALQRIASSEPHPAAVMCLNTIALSERMLGRFDEARATYAELLEEERRLTGEDSARFASCLVSSSTVEFDSGQFEKAIETLTRAEHVFDRCAPATFGAALTCLEKLGVAYERAHRWREALETAERRAPRVAAAFGESSWQALAVDIRAALCMEALGESHEARTRLSQALERAQDAANAEDDSWESAAAALHSRWCALDGEFELAAESLKRARALRDDARIATGANAWTRLAAGVLATRSGAFEKAVEELESLAEMERGPAHGEIAPALARAELARALSATDPERAASLASRARGELTEFLGAQHPSVLSEAPAAPRVDSAR